MNNKNAQDVFAVIYVACVDQRQKKIKTFLSQLSLLFHCQIDAGLVFSANRFHLVVKTTERLIH